jgi:glycine cleavage system H protein
MVELHFPEDLRYAETHEWVRLEPDGTATLGITDYAQDQLGDVVYLELPEAGYEVEDPEVPFGTIESVKAVEDLFCPVRGTVLAVNTELLEHPEWVNEDPYGRGWILKIRLADPQEVERLLTAEQYRTHVHSGA